MRLLGIFRKEESINKRITIDEAKARLRDEQRQPPWDDLDPGIRPIVRILWMEGVETTESCQGGVGHAFPDPTVCFCGEVAAGWTALGVAQAYGLPVWKLRRCYHVTPQGEPTGREWEMTFKLRDYPGWLPFLLAGREAGPALDSSRAETFYEWAKREQEAFDRKALDKFWEPEAESAS